MLNQFDQLHSVFYFQVLCLSTFQFFVTTSILILLNYRIPRSCRFFIPAHSYFFKNICCARCLTDGPKRKPEILITLFMVEMQKFKTGSRYDVPQEMIILHFDHNTSQYAKRERDGGGGGGGGEGGGGVQGQKGGFFCYKFYFFCGEAICLPFYKKDLVFYCYLI